MASHENIVRDVFKAVDEGDMPGVLRLMTDDVYFRFGSNEPTFGQQGVTDSLAALTPAVSSLSHELHKVWWVVDGTEPVAVCEMDVTYKRHSGPTLTLPAVDVIRLRDGLISDCRIYMDINPVFAP